MLHSARNFLFLVNYGRIFFEKTQKNMNNVAGRKRETPGICPRTPKEYFFGQIRGEKPILWGCGGFVSCDVVQNFSRFF